MKKRYIYEEKGGMIIENSGKHDMYRNGEKGRPIYNIIDYKGYPVKYPGDILCMFPMDIKKLKKIK